MRYISTRDNHRAVTASEAILLGMVPEGGLFVPEAIPFLEPDELPSATYLQTAQTVLRPYINDITMAELEGCLRNAYNAETFDAPDIVGLRPLERRRFLLDLWHGPTGAFKDVALQLLPFLSGAAKKKTDDRTRTLILVATSGDTGKAALEGFKDISNVAIAVFYPHEGVSEVQRQQMVTTEGSNTWAFAVKGNFDDCQTAVKSLFGNPVLRKRLAERNTVLSSANSINWGRLCPQIVYYFRAYAKLAAHGILRPGDDVDLCVPTGNFGNILSGWYAKEMGLPVRRLICASNRNHILTDFFRTGVYDVHREFFRTSSPSMDILVSSNLERFLFEITGRDGRHVRAWFEELAEKGRFQVDAPTLRVMGDLIIPGWADEARVFATIGRVFREKGELIDPHTAVGVAVAEDAVEDSGPPVIIASTASPFKFAGDVLFAATGERWADEFLAIEKLSQVAGIPAHRTVRGLANRPVRHTAVLDITQIREAVDKLVDGLDGSGR